MAKVITTIAAENGMDYNDVIAFQTETYVGMWDYGREEWVVFEKYGSTFEPYHLDENFDDLLALDNEVYKHIEEHITDVYDKGGYSLYFDHEGVVLQSYQA